MIFSRKPGKSHDRFSRSQKKQNERIIDHSHITKVTIETKNDANVPEQKTKIPGTLLLFTPRYIFTLAPRFPPDQRGSRRPNPKQIQRAQQRLDKIGSRKGNRGSDKSWAIRCSLYSKKYGRKPARIHSSFPPHFAADDNVCGVNLNWLASSSSASSSGLSLFSRIRRTVTTISADWIPRNFSPLAINFARVRGGEGREGGGGEGCARKWMERETVAKGNMDNRPMGSIMTSLDSRERIFHSWIGE